MKNLTPTIPAVPDFTPVSRKYRYDGWTAERQRAFINALAATGSVKAAAHRINMSPEGAYALRRQPGAESFRAAWNAALDHGVQNLADAMMERALNGVPVPIMYQGAQVAERRVYNERASMFILRHHLPEKYGPLKPLAPGTKHPDTIAREQAEAAGAPSAHVYDAPYSAADVRTFFDRVKDLFAMYRRKVIDEREARLAGRIVEADFTLRQLSHMEVLLELGAIVQPLIDWANGTPCQDDPLEPPWRTEITDELDAIRRTAWAEMGEPARPRVNLTTDPLCRLMEEGDDFEARQAAREDAERRMAEAQRDWEAAATSEAWALRGGAEEHPARAP
jgi:hypothetical protein